MSDGCLVVGMESSADWCNLVDWQEARLVDNLAQTDTLGYCWSRSTLADMLAAAVDSVDRRRFEASTSDESAYWKGTGIRWWVERSVVVVVRQVVQGAGTRVLHIEKSLNRRSGVKSMV